MNTLQSRSKDPYGTLAVRLACLLTLAGYSLKHVAYTGRLTAQVYPETFIDWGVRVFGLSWQGFFPGGSVNANYRAFLTILALVFAVGALVSFLRIPVRTLTGRISVMALYVLTALLITLTAFAAFIDSQLHFNMLLEYSIQITVALLFLHYALGKPVTRRLVTGLKWAIALTFAGHGLYAMNVIPIPANFLMMTSNILQTERSVTLGFLFTAGVLDLVCAIAIFIRTASRPALLYMAVWGFVTALARPVAWYGTADTATWAAMWIPEFLLRAGHWLLPLYLLLVTAPNVAKPAAPAEPGAR